MPHYCVRCGSVLERRVIEGRELEACPNDDFVLWRDPKVATAVVVQADGGIVLGRRAIEPAYGEWCLPGGFVNDDESPLEAAIRECREEIGAEVVVTGLLGVYHIPKHGASSLIGVAYRGRLAGGEAPSAGAEMLEVRVFPPDALPPLAFSSHRQIVSEFLKSPASPEAVVSQIDGAVAPHASPPSPARGRSPRTRTR
jgi:ADP-ribose pyrophosphatase YjhB (NUDIX family)